MEALVGIGIMAAGLLAFVGLIVALVMWSQAQARKRDELWQQAASAMGLTFTTEGWGSPVIEGSFHGFWVRIDIFVRSSGKSSTTYTRVRTWHHPPLGMGLKVTREGIFSGLGKVFGMQDIEVGDHDFDGRFVIKGNEPARVVSLLDLGVRQRMLEYDSRVGSLYMDDEHIYYEKVGVVTDLATLRWLAEAQVAVARAVRESYFKQDSQHAVEIPEYATVGR